MFVAAVRRHYWNPVRGLCVIEQSFENDVNLHALLIGRNLTPGTVRHLAVATALSDHVEVEYLAHPLELVTYCFKVPLVGLKQTDRVGASILAYVRSLNAGAYALTSALPMSTTADSAQVLEVWRYVDRHYDEWVENKMPSFVRQLINRDVDTQS